MHHMPRPIDSWPNKWAAPTLLLLLLCAPLASSTGCVGTEVGNPQDEPSASEIEVGFVGYDHTTAQALTLDSGIEVTRAWLNVEAIELREQRHCNGSEMLLIEGPFAADLLSDLARPPLKSVLVPSGELCMVRLRLRSSERAPDGAPGDLELASVLIEGRTQDGTPFILRAPINETFVMVPRSGSIPLTAQRDSLLIGLAINQLISPALFRNAQPSAEGVNEINMFSNQVTLADFRRSLRRSLRLFRDTNNDRRVALDADLLLAEGEL